MTQEYPKSRRTYKDAVFRDLYGSEDRKDYTLELYNALNGSNHHNPEDITLNMLGDALFIGVRNDVSFVIGNELVLWEHQSTKNPNMALRGLEYFTALYSKEIKRLGSARYSTKRIRISTPRYVVFYMGTKDIQDVETMRLSDSYEGEGDLEVTVRVLNINPGHNEELKSKSKTLRGYCRLIELVRANREEGAEVDEAVSNAVKTCIKEGDLRKYLLERREAVVGMFIGHLTEEEAMAEMREANLREGREEGWEEATVQHVRALMSNLGVEAAAAMDLLGIPEDERADLVSQL